MGQIYNTREDISTHSLTRRLTFDIETSYLDEIISTHSLTRRLTGLLDSFYHEGIISTHSLTRRLTRCIYVQVP